MSELAKLQECGDYDVETSFNNFIALAKSLDSNAYPVLKAGSASDKTKFDTIFEKNLVCEQGTSNSLGAVGGMFSVVKIKLSREIVGQRQGCFGPTHGDSSLIVSSVVLNLIHESITSWDTRGSVLSASFTPPGSKYTHTFRSRNGKKYSFIAVAGANKGSRCITASIVEGGVGHTMVKIKFNSSKAGAWHILVILATSDTDRKALE